VYAFMEQSACTYSFPVASASDCKAPKGAWAISGNGTCTVAYTDQPTGLFPRWAAQRSDPQCNVDPSTGKKAAATIRPNPSFDLPAIALPPGDAFETSALRVRASEQLRTAELNLCAAQRLRAVAPGASGGAALLLPADGQRRLLDVIRARAQRAMLQMATI